MNKTSAKTSAKKDEALQMAINALTNCSRFEETIQACKEALEQPRNFCERCGKRASEDQYHIHTCTPPQALAQPSWQGLNDDEIEQAILSKNKAGEWWGMCLDIARAIEQALKEKNHGIL